MLGVRWLVVVCAASLAVGATGAPAHADELCGVYELREDSDGETPTKDSTIRLTLRNGKARVVAKRPGAEVTDRGKYTLHSRSRITIRFNELPFRARKKPYRLEGSALTLPFKALSDGSGTSLWRRVSTCESTGKRGKKKPPKKPKDDDSDEADHEPGDSSPGEGPRPGETEYKRRGRGPVHFMQPPKRGDKQATVADFEGMWFGTGWGWEVRFEQKRRGFTKQLFKGKKRGGYKRLSKGKEGVLMTLTVEHHTDFWLWVDERGNITGDGTISYSLYPNLCGVAALTRLVNERINLLDKLPFIYKLAREIGAAMVTRFNARMLAIEGRWAASAKHYTKHFAIRKAAIAGNKAKQAGKLAKAAKTAAKKAQREAAKAAKYATKKSRAARKAGRGGAKKAKDSANATKRAENAAKAAREAEARAEGAAKRAVEAAAAAKTAAAKAKQAAHKIFKNVAAEYLGGKATDMLKDALNRTKRDEAVCAYADGKTTAGTRVGPETLQETIVELAAQAPKAIYDVVTGDVPMSLILSIPGYTQIQYSYRGIPNDTDVTRTFRIKGQLELTSAGPRMTLAIDGKIDAPRKLPLEYQVNFKTTKTSFPTWTPFRDDAGIARRSGKRTTYRHAVETVRHTVVHPDTKESITIEYEHRTAYARDDQQNTPFATFFEDGTKRDGKKMWHDYEYYWSAYKYEPAGDEDSDAAASTEFELE